MNKITEWTYDKPTEPGLYLMCYGDVEVQKNMTLANVINENGELIDEVDCTPVYNFQPGYKYARLIIGSAARE